MFARGIAPVVGDASKPQALPRSIVILRSQRLLSASIRRQHRPSEIVEGRTDLFRARGLPL
jgi:hypothetical protein